MKTEKLKALIAETAKRADSISVSGVKNCAAVVDIYSYAAEALREINAIEDEENKETEESEENKTEG